MQCKATNRAGERCKRHATKGKTVCRMHGGATPSGVAAPAFKNGKYSKYVPAALMEKYQEAMSDPDLLSMRNEIALIDSRVNQLLETLQDERPYRDTVETMKTAVADFEKAQDKGDGRLMMAAMAKIKECAQGLERDAATWGEISSMFATRRTLADSERKRLLEMRQLVTSEQAMTFATALLLAVKAHVTDRQTLNAIQNEFIRLTNRPDLEGTNGAAGG